jgi:hypothetical protein
MDNKVVNIKVEHNLDQTVKSTNNLSGALKGATNSVGELSGKSATLSKLEGGINSIGGAVGSLNPAFGAAIKGSNGLILKMWEMVANPVGAILAAIVVTLKFLYEAFQSSVAGGKELKAAFAAVSAIGTQVKDALFGLGRALIDVATAAFKFITLDFKGAAESMKKANKEATESYKQLGNAVDGTTAKLIYNLEKQQQANDKARKMQAVVQSETNKLLVQSRETLTDETASLKDKKKALEDVTKAEKSSSAEKVRIAAEDLKIAKEKAKAMGGEAEKKAKQELRELTIALNEAETENAMTGIKLNKQKKMLNRQETADAKEAADAQKEILKTKSEAEKTALKQKNDNIKAAFELEKSNVDEQLKNAKLSIDEKRNIVLNDNKLSKADRQKFLLDLQAQEIAQEEAHNKAIADLNKRYDDEKANRLAVTAVQKEELDYQRRLAEINSLAKTELEKQTLIEKLDGEHKVRMGAATLKDKEDVSKKEAEFEQQKNNAIAKSKENLTNIISGLESSGLAKTKAGQIASKAIALTQIGIDSAVAISKASTLANAEGVAAQLAFPMVPGIGTIARITSYAATGLSVISNIVRAKKLLSGGGAAGGGGGGGGGGAPAGGGGGGAAPQFNVVGNAGVNQLAQTMNNQTQSPIQAFVVAQNVTTAQSLNRNIVSNASLG